MIKITLRKFGSDKHCKNMCQINHQPIKLVFGYDTQ
jgi:hypothetical protein